MLPCAGRLTLIQYVISQISIYHLSYYKLTKEEARKEIRLIIENICWNDQKLRGIYEEEKVRNISEIPISRSMRDDKIIWKRAASGIYTVKEAIKVGKVDERNQP